MCRPRVAQPIPTKLVTNAREVTRILVLRPPFLKSTTSRTERRGVGECERSTCCAQFQRVAFISHLAQRAWIKSIWHMARKWRTNGTLFSSNIPRNTQIFHPTFTVFFAMSVVPLTSDTPPTIFTRTTTSSAAASSRSCAMAYAVWPTCGTQPTPHSHDARMKQARTDKT